MDDLRKLREKLERSEPKDEAGRRTLGVLRSLDSTPITLVLKSQGSSGSGLLGGKDRTTDATGTSEESGLNNALNMSDRGTSAATSNSNTGSRRADPRTDSSSGMKLKEADELVSMLKNKYKPNSEEMAGKQQSVFESVEKKLINCYATNKGQTMNCSNVLKEYQDYVKAQRNLVLKKSLHMSPVLTTVMMIVTCLLLHIATVSCYGAMSIDLGSEWMKVGLVAPSVQMDIVLNAQSQRKTPMAIAFSNGERFIGDTALDIASKYPERTFTHFLDLLGKTIDHDSVKHYKQRFPYANISAAEAKPDDTQSIILNHPEGLEFTPLELIAMMIQHAHDQVVSRLDSFEPASDVVITVPPFFGPAERKVVEDAARLVGLNVLRLTNTNSAFALSYGIFRHKDYLPASDENRTTILFFDQGASHTSVTVADYQLLEQFDEATGLSKNESLPTVTIRAQAYDRYLGGFDMQLKLRDHLVDVFVKKTKIDKHRLTKRGKSMAKLLKEAGRVKKILSANTDHVVRVENVIDDQDLKHPITRQEFEEMNSEYLGSRVTQLFDKLYELPNVSRDDKFESVIIVGGNTRTPKLQQILMDHFKLEALGKSINADEGAALAALYQAASLGRGFRVKKFALQEFDEASPSAATPAPESNTESPTTDAPSNQTSTQEPEVDVFASSRAKLAKLREQDDLRLRRLSLKNSLESLISEAKDKLSEDAEKMKLVSETYVWLEDGPQQETDNVTALEEKFRNIHELVYPRPPPVPSFDPSKVDLSSVLSNETLSILDSLNFTNPFAQAPTTPESGTDNNTSTEAENQPSTEEATTTATTTSAPSDPRGPPPHSEL